MTKKEELELFLLRSDELIESKYILADLKIVNLLKSIANSKTLVAIFQACLKDFDYEKVSAKCFTTSEFLGQDKGQFNQPESSKTLLALVFTLLMDFDSKKIDFADFLNTYFYENGSYYQSYKAFVKDLIIPFKFTVKTLMTGIISGSVGDPIVELDKKAEEPKIDKNEPIFTQIKELLSKDKEKISLKKNESKKADGLFIIDTFEGVLSSLDEDAINYAYIAYKYGMAFLLPFRNKSKAIKKLLDGIEYGN